MDVGGWLRKLGLEQYEPAFRENKIDRTILPRLTADDLKELGVASVGDRRRLLDAIASLRDEAAPIAEGTAGPGAAVRGDGGGSLGSDAERRQLTVMFCDLVGSTALSARLDPEDMREIIGAYHRCCAWVIAKGGGFVAKYMGDGVLAYFGYPQAHEDDAERAVRSGLALTEAISQLRTAHNALLQVRIGIATGLVVVGDLIGEGDAQERGVVGDTPNLAARLQSLAEPGRVVISHGTRRLTGGLFDYHDLGRVTLKGLADPVQAWQVTGTSAVQSRFEAQHETNLTPLVGRDEELELLLRRWRQAASGEGRVVLLSGEPGIGKSRLTVALQEQLQEEQHTRLEYFCSPHHSDSAFYPAIAQLERAAGFERHDTAEAKLDKLASLVAPSSDSDIQLVAELLSIPTADRYPRLNLSPQRKKDKTFEALLRRLEMLCRQRPALMVYEDVHWIDPSSRELLDMVVERVARLSVLLIVTFRPEFQPPWTGQAHVTTQSLSRLGQREGAALVERVAGNNALPDAIAAEIVERTDGVPLFVEELTKAVLEADARDLDGMRTVSTAPLPALAIPASLNASLMARLDRLGPAAKEIAQIGAVIGREFSYDLVAPVAQKSEPELRSALDRLTNAGLVFSRGIPPQATFLFKHALVRDAAYGSLLRSRRQQLHSHIASILEVQFPEIVAAQYELLAQHCAEGGLVQKAVGYWLKAGQHSMARSAMVEASAQLKKGLDIVMRLPDDPSRLEHELDLQIALGQALMATQGWGSLEVQVIYARAHQLCAQLNRSPQLVAALYGLWVNHLNRLELQLAHRLAAEMRQLGEDRDEATIRVMGGRLAGVTNYFLGEFATSRVELEQALLLFDPGDRPFYSTLSANDGRVVLLSFLSRSLVALGYLDQARSRCDEALDEARQLSQPLTLGYALHYCGLGAWGVAMAPDLLRRIDELEALSTEQKFPLLCAGAAVSRGWCLNALGQQAEGIAQLTHGMAAYRATGTSFDVPLHLTLLGNAYGKAQQPDQGLRQLADAARIIEVTQVRWLEAELHRVRGQLLTSKEDLPAAEECYREALAVARRQNARLWELRASTSLARLWLDQSKRTEARDLLAPIYGWFTEGFDTPDLKEAKALLDMLR